MRHLIRVTRRYELTKKKTMTKTEANTKAMTKTNTFRDYLQRATPEAFKTFDQSHEET